MVRTFCPCRIKSLEEARKLDAQVLIEKFRDYAGIGSGLGPGVKMWSPVIDGKVQTVISQK